jgi:RimJ/RimL family protein N-acetyltransferase
MIDTETLRGKRVSIRHMVRADVDAMAGWPPFREAELQWANLDLTFPSERDIYFDRGRTNESRRRFVIIDEDNQIIGTVGLRNVDLRARQATLGIIVRADAVGKGYGTDAVETVLGYAFDVLELDRVLLDVADTNYRARHVYDKIGFTPIGQHLGPQNQIYVDMALARAEYERRYKTPHYSRRGRRLSG